MVSHAQSGKVIWANQVYGIGGIPTVPSAVLGIYTISTTSIIDY